MPNIFDQFDVQTKTPAMGNVFDQFDAASITPPEGDAGMPETPTPTSGADRMPRTNPFAQPANEEVPYYIARDFSRSPLGRTIADYNRNVGDIRERRAERMADSARAYVGDEQTAIETMLQQALGYAGGLTDTIGVGVSALIPDIIEKPITTAIGSTANVLSKVPSAVGLPDFSNTAQYIENNPRVKRNFEAGVDAVGLGSLLLGGKPAVETAIPLAEKTIPIVEKGVVKTGRVATAPVRGAYQGVKKVGEGRAANKMARMRAETEAFGSGKDALRQQLKAENVQFTPEQSGQLAKKLKTVAPSDDLGKRDWSGSRAEKHLRDITESLAVENPSLDALAYKRASINSDITKAVRAGDKAEKTRLLELKDALTEGMKDADTGTWQKFNHAFGQHATLDDIDNLVERAASRTTQPANSLDTEINAWLRRHGKTLNDEEYRALKDVTNNTVGGKLRKAAAGGLIKHTAAVAGSSVGGLPGATAGYLIGHFGSEFAKDAAMLSKLRKLDKFRELVMNRKAPRSGVNITKANPKEATKLLAAPGKLSRLPMTERELNIARAQINRGNRGIVPSEGSAIRKGKPMTLSDFITDIQDTEMNKMNRIPRSDLFKK